MPVASAPRRAIAGLRRVVVAACAIVAVPAAWAGGSASLTTWDQRGEASTTQVDFDGARMRVDSSALPDGYLLMRGDDAKMVMPVGGAAAVVDLPALMKMLGPRARSLTEGTDSVREIVSLTDTGKRETVAGIAGSLYHLVYVDQTGQKMRAELVLSRDARVVELTRGLHGLLTRMQQAAKVKLPPGAGKLEQTLESKQLGVLRYADRFLVTRLDGRTPADARFALPSSTLAVPDLSGLKSILGGR
ncbi:MAG: hypothetical protein QM766_15280 [Burkholderiaceae bacterium]